MFLAIFCLLPIVLIAVSVLGQKIQFPKNDSSDNLSLHHYLWLSYKIGVWIFAPLLFIFSEIDNNLRIVFIFHLISLSTASLIFILLNIRKVHHIKKYKMIFHFFHLISFVFLFNFFWPETISRLTLVSIVLSFSLILSLIFELILKTIFFRHGQIQIIVNIICYTILIFHILLTFELAL